MTMDPPPRDAPEREARPDPQSELARLLSGLRPRLHRYCARMMGSFIDGEDALQDGLARAVQAFDGLTQLQNPEGWVFRIVHHATLDLLRHRAREPLFTVDEELPAMPDATLDPEARLTAAAHLGTFMRLPSSQRACVILMDVLGHSLAELVTITGASLPAVKASLHRGRARLRALAAEPEAAVPVMLEARDRALLAAYVARFNARDFDAVRDMLRDEVRVEVVGRATLQGKAAVAGTYFGNYAATADWVFVPGLVEGHPAALVYPPEQPEAAHPSYFVVLRWAGGRLASARDFRHTRYSTEGVSFTRL